MEGNEKNVAVIEDRSAADALIDMTLLPLLAIFLRREASVSEATETLEADLDEVYYRVRKLVQLGILEVVRRDKRAGRPIKIYRASASAFFIPFAVLPHETFAKALLASSRIPDQMMAEGTARALLGEVDDPYQWGFRVYIDAKGTISAMWGPRDAGEDWSVLDHLLEADRPPVYGTNITLSLTQEESKELQAELHGFMSQWRKRSRSNRVGGHHGPTREILLSVGMAPE